MRAVFHFCKRRFFYELFTRACHRRRRLYWLQLYLLYAQAFHRRVYIEPGPVSPMQAAWKTSKTFRLEARYQFVQADICDQQTVTELMRAYNIDAVVHFAAESHVDRSILGPAAFMNTNISGAFSLLEAARAVWLTEKKLKPEQVRFHHISTDEVFGSLRPGVRRSLKPRPIHQIPLTLLPKPAAAPWCALTTRTTSR